MKKAVGYARTSSLTNVGDGKDSLLRQKAAIEAYASSAGYKIMGWYYDAGVSGTIPVVDRDGFKRMLESLGDIDTVLMESADRFARDLVVQIVGYDLLTDKGITLIPVNSPGFFNEQTPTGEFIRNVLGAVAQFEKSNLVNRLKVARMRKKQNGGKGEGRYSLAQTLDPMVTTEVMRLRSQGFGVDKIAQIVTKKYPLLLPRQYLERNQVYKIIKWVQKHGFPLNYKDIRDDIKRNNSIS